MSNCFISKIRGVALFACTDVGTGVRGEGVEASQGAGGHLTRIGSSTHPIHGAIPTLAMSPGDSRNLLKFVAVS